MSRKRFIAPWQDSLTKPSIYHCVSRVVDRRFVFEAAERERFRMFMRMYENFSGCRVLSYCIMSNHFHILLEVPPMPLGGISDEVLLKRLSAIYTEAVVAAENGTVLPDLGLAAMLRCRVRYFTDGAVIGSKEFVNEAFAAAQERFSVKRKDGARRMRGNGAQAAGLLWSVRDLRVRV